MDNVIKFPRQARTSRRSRAASRAKRSAVKPALRAISVCKIGDHHSAGILSLCGHLRTAATPAPISPASASGVSHKDTTSRKFSNMTELLGQPVLEIKGNSSLDGLIMAGQTVPMTTDEYRAYLIEFGERLREARAGRKQTLIAKQLGVDQSGYSKWERGEREMPLYLVPEFCELCDYPPGRLIGRVPRIKRKTG